MRLFFLSGRPTPTLPQNCQLACDSIVRRYPYLHIALRHPLSLLHRPYNPNQPKSNNCLFLRVHLPTYPTFLLCSSWHINQSSPTPTPNSRTQGHGLEGCLAAIGRQGLEWGRGEVGGQVGQRLEPEGEGLQLPAFVYIGVWGLVGISMGGAGRSIYIHIYM